jgi:hypothetical protein
MIFWSKQKLILQASLRNHTVWLLCMNPSVIFIKLVLLLEQASVSMFSTWGVRLCLLKEPYLKERLASFAQSRPQPSHHPAYGIEDTFREEMQPTCRRKWELAVCQRRGKILRAYWRICNQRVWSTSTVYYDHQIRRVVPTPKYLPLQRKTWIGYSLEHWIWVRPSIILTELNKAINRSDVQTDDVNI